MMNKPRLIDANFIEQYITREEHKTPDERWRPESEFAAMIDNTPTAYDINEVVEELEELKQLSIRNECVRHGKCPDHCNAHYVSRAIEIVKGGAE